MRDNTLVIASEDQKERVRSFFDENRAWQGDFYTSTSDYFARLIQRRKQYAIGMLAGIPRGENTTALDIGCGAGAYLEELVKLGYVSTGIDMSPEMLASSRNRLAGSEAHASRVRLLLGDAEHLPVEDSGFDLVLCIGVLGYLVRDEQALSEITRVLKPGGHLLLNVTNLYSLSDLDYHVRRKIRTALRPGAGHGQAPADLPYASHSEWMLKNRRYLNKSYRLGSFETLLRDYGLERIDRMTFGFEFRLLRRLGLVPRAQLDRMELALESAFRRRPVPYLSLSGWGYIGLFKRRS